MPKLNYAQAKSKFKTNEDIASYFILVESYEKHLNADQKEGFLNPDTIEDMFKVLSDQQLRYLKSSVKLFASIKFAGLGDEHYGGEGLSEWFVKKSV